MEIKKYFNFTRDEVDLKKSNIFIPICLGNKFFSEKNKINKNLEEYLQWALNHTRERVLFVIVDKIQDTNYYVRNHRSSEEASLRHVLEDGKKIRSELEKLLKKYPGETVSIINWEEFDIDDPFCGQTTHIVYKEFKNNKKFSDAVSQAVKVSIKDRIFSESDYWKLCDYVLDEFSIVYSGATHKGVYYGLYPYPDTDAVLELIENIKNGSSFLELNKKLPKVKNGVVILS